MAMALRKISVRMAQTNVPSRAWVIFGTCALCFACVHRGVAQVGTLIQNHPAKLVVRYADLDLTHRAGVMELYRRIEQAARVVCNSPAAAPSARPEEDGCPMDAIARAVAEIDQPALTRYFAARLQQRPAAALHEGHLLKSNEK
jgi:UrcA family protein